MDPGDFPQAAADSGPGGLGAGQRWVLSADQPPSCTVHFTGPGKAGPAWPERASKKCVCLPAPLLVPGEAAT